MTTLAGAGVTRAATRAAEPREGVTVIDRDCARAFALDGARRDAGRVEAIKVVGQPFERGVRLCTKVTLASEPELQFAAPTTRPVAAGDVLHARFWLRCHDSMSGEGYTTFTFESAAPDVTKPVEFRVGAGSDWREVNVPFRAGRGYAAGEARVAFRLGFDRQTIEIAAISVVQLGADAPLDALPRTTITYAGRERDVAWRQAAHARIERYRKAPLTVRVTDVAGNPVPGADIRATLRRHAFGFGSAVTAEHLLGESDDAARYRQIVERYFNTAVFENDMKWQEDAAGLAPRVDAALDWLLARGFRVRGHNLLWPSWRWLPAALRDVASDPAELRRRTGERVTSAVARYRGKLIHWDVVNEPYSERDVMDILGDDVMVEWFRLAKQADPSCRMYLNDFGIFDGGPDNPHRRHFFDTIVSLKRRGAPIDGIGIQSHFSALPAPPQRLLDVLDQFSEIGLPIESTELSLNMTDRPLQADYMRDYLTALFSHPNVHGIMLWGFWEGRHWRPDAALFARDWTPRPVAAAWIDLVHGQWKTDARVTADRSGRATIRGFCGEYDLIVSAGGDSKKVSTRLDHGGGDVAVVLDGRARDTR